MDRAELRRLADDASANRKHMVAVGTAASCRDTEMSERAFQAAASPDVVLDLLNRLDNWEQGTASACAKAMIKTADDLLKERDQLRAVAVRLKLALQELESRVFEDGAPDDVLEEVQGILADPEVEKL